MTTPQPHDCPWCKHPTTNTTDPYIDNQPPPHEPPPDTPRCHYCQATNAPRAHLQTTIADLAAMLHQLEKRLNQ